MRPKPLIPMRVAMSWLSSVGQDHSAGQCRRQQDGAAIFFGILERLLRGGVGLDVRRDEADELARQRDDFARVVAGLAHLTIDALRQDLDRLFTLTASLRL